jgi:hypothetical protein
MNRIKTVPLSPAGNGDRDLKSGRFIAGNQCGRGNPVHRRLAANRSLLLATVSTDELRDLFRDLYRRALAGDNDACRIILGYMVGKPKEAVSEDDNDLDEWSKADAMPSLCRVWARMLESITPQQALQLLQDALKTRSGQGIKDLKPIDNERVIGEMKSRVGK